MFIFDDKLIFQDIYFSHQFSVLHISEDASVRERKNGQYSCPGYICLVNLPFIGSVCRNP